MEQEPEIIPDEYYLVLPDGTRILKDEFYLRFRVKRRKNVPEDRMTPETAIRVLEQAGYKLTEAEIQEWLKTMNAK